MIPVLPRRLVAVLVLALGVGQALDSGIRAAPAGVIALVLAGLAVSVIAYWRSGHAGVLFASGVTTMIIVTLARVLSPVPLPTLTLAGWFPVMAALLLGQVARQAEARKRQG